MPIDPQPSSIASMAVLHYFEGERREMLVILATACVLAVASVLLFLAARDGFAKALMVTVLTSAVLLSATAGSLLVRDAALRATLSAPIGLGQAGLGQAESALAGERSRITRVIAKYPLYRAVALLLGLVALAVLLLSRQGWLHGVAVGLLLLVAAQVCIDHYSERRAGLYLRSLAGLQAR